MARNTILLRGSAREETGIATGSAITPGSAVVQSGAGAGWAAAGAAAFAIAFARQQHENQGNTINDAIAQNDEMTIIFPEYGAKLLGVSSETIDRGDELTTAASGKLAVRAVGEPLIGIAVGPNDADDRVEFYFTPSLIGSESA